MGTRHVFRPSRLRNLGPGLLVSALLGMGASAAIRERLLPPSPWLLAVVALPAVVAYFRWLLKGCVTVTRDEVLVRGWVTRTDQDGVTRRAYVRERVPRNQWGSIRVEGLLFPRVIWSRFGVDVTLEQVGQPRRLSRLLTAPAEEFAASERPSLILIVAYGMLQLIGWGLGRGGKMLVQTVQRAHRDEPPPPETTAVAGDPLSYEDFVTYCADLCARRPSGTKGHIRRIYNAILERAHMMTTRANGHAPGVLHPRITGVEEVTKRIPEAIYNRMLREVLGEARHRGSPETLSPEPVLD